MKAITNALYRLPFRFESYGVRVELSGNDPDTVAHAAEVTRIALLNNIREVADGDFDHHFEVTRTKGGTFVLVQNGKRLASGRSKEKFFRLLDSMVCVAVGEYAVNRVFMHAGVVGWNGKAIIIPANSFQGKTTLVAELVRNGGTYYSDEFAIFDSDGLVHPFARPLSMRTIEGRSRTYELTAASLGGTHGIEPLEVGTVLLTQYGPNSRWRPKLLSPGAGILKMMPHALSLRYRPDFTVRVLNKIAGGAIIASSRRGSADKFAKTLLNFVDKHVN